MRNPFKRFLNWINPVYGTINFASPGSYSASKATKLSTVFRCVNLLSDSIASLPMNPYYYDGDWKKINYIDGKYNLLNVQPNPFQSSFIFKKMMIANVLLRGNAYILIDRANSGKIKGLYLLNPDLMTPMITATDIIYNYGGTITYDKSQIIHIINYSDDGLTGKSTITYAGESLGIAYSSEQHASNFWTSGGNMAGILAPKPGAQMSKGQAKTAKDAMVEQLSSELGGKSNSIIVLGDGLEYQPISVNPKDSQLLESRQFNVLEICRFFGVPPTLAFSESGKFSTAEQQSLDFLNNALTPLLEKIESEFFRKLYLESEWDRSELKFDAENILRLDAVTRADFYSKLFNIGAYTTNEIREKLNAPFPQKNGNRSFVQVNMQPLDNLISEQKNQPNQIDNQVL